MLIEQVDMQVQLSTVLKITDLCLHLFHMLLESVQYVAWFVACEVLIAYTASGTCYYEDLLHLKRSAILLSSSLPAPAHLPFFRSYTAISAGRKGVRADHPAFYRIFLLYPNPIFISTEWTIKIQIFVCLFVVWTTIDFFQHVVILQIWQKYQEENNMQQQSWLHLQLQLPQIMSYDVPSSPADIFKAP